MVYQESETITPSCRLESCGVFPVCTAVQGRPCCLSMSMRAKGVTTCSITRVEVLLVIPRPVWVPGQAHFCTILSLKDISLVILFHFSLYCIHVCLVYVCMPVCMLVHKCGHGVCWCARVLWPEAEVGCLPWLLSLVWLVHLACLVLESPVYGLRADYRRATMHSQHLCGCQGSKLQTLHLCGKYFIDTFSCFPSFWLPFLIKNSSSE